MNTKNSKYVCNTIENKKMKKGDMNKITIISFN